MEINLNGLGREHLLVSDSCASAEELVVLAKMNKDERVVRKALVKTWTKILEKYARSGVPIPSAEEIHRELLEEGVHAGVDAVMKEHWFVRRAMVEEKVRHHVEKGMRDLNIPEIIEDVRAVQNDPGLLQQFRERIKHYVL
ncbi:MAG: hypothetical protein COT85_04470 [Chlamydiae bacterium CG10_big_fil_rev_8_21_14_0_10_42_34]|nr:MAG: hypothetical protein COT85_04470 [Chlamydiae bacterium CG10_big_fil_rev_8_21_14_0_10_42_34]